MPARKSEARNHDCDNYGNDRVCTEAVDLWRHRPSFSSAARRRQFIDSAAGYTGKAGRDDQENHSTNRKAGGAFHGSQSQCRLDAFNSGQASDDVGVQSLQVLHVSKNDAQ